MQIVLVRTARQYIQVSQYSPSWNRADLTDIAMPINRPVHYDRLF